MPAARRASAKKDEAKQDPPAEVSPPPPEPILKTELDAVIEQLRRPFTAEAVKFKIQANPKDENGSALIVGYIDARLVSERLNAVAPGRWSHVYVAPPNPSSKSVACRIKLRVDADTEVVREDVGWASGGKMDEDQGYKGLYSDAFKRAAVHFGIGVSMYAFPQQWVKANKLRSWRKGEKTMWEMTDAATNEVLANYRRWLKDVAVPLFGEPLSHGDAEGAQGDIDIEHAAPAPEEFVDVPPFGPEASPALTESGRKAVAFLLGDDPVACDDAWQAIDAKFGYMPEAALAAIGIVAATRKKALDAAQAEAAPETSPTDQ